MPTTLPEKCCRKDCPNPAEFLFTMRESPRVYCAGHAQENREQAPNWIDKEEPIGPR